MRKLLAAAAALLLIGAGCSAQTSGNADVTVPAGEVNVGAEGGYNY